MRCSRSALVSIYQMRSKEETGRLEEGQGRLTGKHRENKPCALILQTAPLSENVHAGSDRKVPEYRVPMVIPVHSWARRIRTAPWINGRRLPGLMNHAFFYYRGRQGVCALLTWYQDAPWEEGKLMEVVWCWETLSPAIYVDVTLTTTHLSIVADHVLPFMETVFPVCCGLLQQLLLVMVHWLCGCLFICGRDISKDMFTWLTQLYRHHPVHLCLLHLWSLCTTFPG